MMKEEIARLIYEATRIEAGWSNRPVVPEAWEQRDEKFRKQFIEIVSQYLSMQELPSPEEAHISWMDAYLLMGWQYGETRNPIKKTHPDILPFDQLPKDERDKDAIFLSFLWLVKFLLTSLTEMEERVKGLKDELDSETKWAKEYFDKWEQDEFRIKEL